MDTAVRSLTVMWDGSLIVAANNRGTCYVWRLLRGTEVTSGPILQFKTVALLLIEEKTAPDLFREP